MSEDIIEIENCQIRINRLQNIRIISDSIDLQKFISFCNNTTIIDKSFDFKMCDPRQCKEDIAILANIHEIIKKDTNNLQERDKGAAHYWLASLFHLYFERYELYKEGWGCRKAWTHLLRLRYHGMVDILLNKKDNEVLSENEQYHFRLSLRDWYNFCANKANHFMFNTKQELQSVETEIRQIIYGEEKQNKQPLSFFLKYPVGQSIFDRLVADWFLRDRYDWKEAVNLTIYKLFQGKKWLTSILVTIVLILILAITGINILYTHLGAVLFTLYISLFTLAAASVFHRNISNILLPRLLVSILVGYLPLMMTPEIWKMIPNICTIQCILLFLMVPFLSFLYLRWEIGNRLARTPQVNNRIPITRALVIMVYGLFSSFFMGLIILDLIGAHLILASFGDDPPPKMYPGLFGEIYFKGLLLLFPFALLIGVIVQVFWEEKSITHPLE